MRGGTPAAVGGSFPEGGPEGKVICWEPLITISFLGFSASRNLFYFSMSFVFIFVFSFRRYFFSVFFRYFFYMFFCLSFSARGCYSFLPANGVCRTSLPRLFF